MSLTIEDKFQYWLSYANNDMDSAEFMLKSGRWYYTVFMCQQAIEKLIKGLYLLYVDDNVPRLHDINGIFDRFRDKLPGQLSDDQLGLFDTLSQFYLKSREAYQWLLTMKP
jgi:HEPN domain-containing protein